MRINVIDQETGAALFDYKSNVVPRSGEIIWGSEDGKMDLVVRIVLHRLSQEQGEPFVDLFCVPR